MALPKRPETPSSSRAIADSNSCRSISWSLLRSRLAARMRVWSWDSSIPTDFKSGFSSLRLMRPEPSTSKSLNAVSNFSDFWRRPWAAVMASSSFKLLPRFGAMMSSSFRACVSVSSTPATSRTMVRISSASINPDPSLSALRKVLWISFLFFVNSATFLTSPNETSPSESLSSFKISWSACSFVRLIPYLLAAAMISTLSSFPLASLSMSLKRLSTGSSRSEASLDSASTSSTLVSPTKSPSLT
mmetsp:Transcript_24832/g.59091  ORF Transcript_24832/g.59091 Transcript_24832/m.59091 type:complete len:245 (+) Transcript_24832:1995-2729(+)